MLPTIITKYHGPTDCKPSRISARAVLAQSKRRVTVYVPYDYERSSIDNHYRAARKLFDKHFADAAACSLVAGDMPETAIVWVAITPKTRRSLCTLGSLSYTD